MKKILHIIPDSFIRPEHEYTGSTKDISGRTDYFSQRQYEITSVIAENRSDITLMKKLSKIELENYFAVIIEYPRYPRSIALIRKKNPNIVILTRSHNAEFYHALHQITALIFNIQGLVRIRGRKQILILLCKVLKNCNKLYLDYLCAKGSDYILSISQWETDNYWKYLTNSSKIITVPFFLPHRYITEINSYSDVLIKKNQCITLMSTTGGTLPFTLDAARNFIKCVKMLGEDYPDWEFYITGRISTEPLGLPSRIIYTGFLNSPFQILNGSRSMALLSNYGFGFKTKILEAIECHCYPLIPKELHNRIPQELQRFCIIVDVSSKKSFKDALDKSLKPFPQNNVNDMLREKAFREMDFILEY